MKHVLVTGGAGFIGSHLVDAYLDRGWRVSVIDNLSTGERKNMNARAELHVADVRESTALVGELRPDLVSHHAAQVDVRLSVADPAADADVNVLASLRLLQKSLEAGVKRFIFASSGGAIYGEPAFAPQSEEHPLQPMSPYGCAKLSVEHYMNYYRNIHGLSCVALRYANVYGPRQSSKGEAGVVAIFAHRLLRGEEVTINGSGEQTRDFVFVKDVVAANMAVSENLELTGAFNVGTGVETSVNALYLLMRSILGVPREANRGIAMAGEQMRSVIAATRLGPIIGPFRPLRSGLEETIHFFRSGSSHSVG